MTKASSVSITYLTTYVHMHCTIPSLMVYIQHVYGCFYCVHSASVGRSATFCALKIAVEQVKTEGIIDVFYTVHTMRTRQPLSVRQIVSFYQFDFIPLES